MTAATGALREAKREEIRVLEEESRKLCWWKVASFALVASSSALMFVYPDQKYPYLLAIGSLLFFIKHMVKSDDLHSRIMSNWSYIRGCWETETDMEREAAS